MIANREHEGKWDPAMGYPLSQPYHLRGVGELAKEHVNHRENVSCYTHKEEPNARLEFLVTSVGCGNEEVDENRDQQQSNRQRLEAVKHGGHRAGFRVDVKESKNERKNVGGEQNDREQKSDHGGVGLAGKAPVSVSSRGDHAATDEAVQQSDGEEIECSIA